jgi:hypothetical protein
MECSRKRNGVVILERLVNPKNVLVFLQAQVIRRKDLEFTKE